jgi:hypothetical protein
MDKCLILITLVVSVFVAGCDRRTGDYVAASSISQNGFARDGNAMRALNGQEVKLWGFVDHNNMYGDGGARLILGDWWSGEGPRAATWQFNLKARADDQAGKSFAVHVPNDQGRDDLLRLFVADAKAGKPTQVFITGRLFTFDAPTNAGVFTGLYIELQSAHDIQLQR